MGIQTVGVRYSTVKSGFVRLFFLITRTVRFCFPAQNSFSLINTLAISSSEKTGSAGPRKTSPNADTLALHDLKRRALSKPRRARAKGGISCARLFACRDTRELPDQRSPRTGSETTQTNVRSRSVPAFCSVDLTSGQSLGVLKSRAIHSQRFFNLATSPPSDRARCRVSCRCARQGRSRRHRFPCDREAVAAAPS